MKTFIALSFLIFTIIDAFSQGEVKRSSTIDHPKKFSTPTLEITYMGTTVIKPGQGAGFHLQFPRKHDWEDVIHFSGGFGGNYFQIYGFPLKIGQAYETIDRVSGHVTGSFKVMDPQGGIILRLGYNYAYSEFSPFNRRHNAITCYICEDIKAKSYHFIHNEFLFFKSFGKKLTGVGILGGMQVLLNPFNINKSLINFKVGFGF